MLTENLSPELRALLLVAHIEDEERRQRLFDIVTKHLTILDKLTNPEKYYQKREEYLQ